MLLVALPRSPARMPNVHDPCFVGFDAPIDQIWIAAGRKHPRGLFAGSPPTLGELADELDRLPDGALDALRALRAVRVDVLENRLKVAARPRREAHSHRPCRFQRASISSSGTNSPRRACSNPSRIAVRVSSSRATTGLSSVIASMATATASWSSAGSARALAIAISSSLVMRCTLSHVLAVCIDRRTRGGEGLPAEARRAQAGARAQCHRWCVFTCSGGDRSLRLQPRGLDHLAP